MASCHRPFLYTCIWAVTKFMCASFYHCFCSFHQDLPFFCLDQFTLYFFCYWDIFLYTCQVPVCWTAIFRLCSLHYSLHRCFFLSIVCGVNFKWKKLIEEERIFSFILVVIPVTFKRIYILFLYTKNWNLFFPITLSLWVDIEMIWNSISLESVWLKDCHI
jgi:hypothetical protein